jgi:hypothetical protein
VTDGADRVGTGRALARTSRHVGLIGLADEHEPVGERDERSTISRPTSFATLPT